MTPAIRFRPPGRILSDRERVLIGAGVMALLLFLAIRQLVFPMLSEYRKTRAAIPQRLATIARYGVAAEGEDRVEERLAERQGRLEALEEGLLPGDSPAAAGAALQGMLKPGIQRSKLRLISLRALPPLAKGPYTEVAVQVDLQGTTEGMATLLAEIARQTKTVRVRKLNVASGIYSQAMAARPDTLMVTVEVAGMTDAAVEDKSVGGAR